MTNFASIILASQEAHTVSTGVTLLFACLLVGLIACLALEEKLHAKKSVIAGAFAVACLLLGAAFGILPFERIVVGSHEVVQHPEFEADVKTSEDDESPNHIPIEDKEPLHVDGHRIEMPVYIPAIDWSVIAIILGSSLFVDVVSKSGLFTWIAIRVTKFSRGDPMLLLVYYGVMTVVFSAVLNNVTAMIIVGSLSVVSLEKLGRRDQLLGFLLVESLLTNIGGLLTLISSVPNIIVGTTAGISFVEFFYKSAPYVLVATAATIWLGTRLFRIHRLVDEQQQAEAAELVASFDEKDGIESWGFFWFGAAMTLLFIITIATTSVLPWVSNLGMGYVALSFAAIMLIRYKAVADKLYQAIDWDLLAFFAALFVVINVMEHALVLDLIGKGLNPLIDLGETAGSACLLVAAAVFSSVTDNIPLAAMLAKILHGNIGEDPQNPFWWAVVFGANLGGNLTPIGSASTLVAVTIMHKHKLAMSFAGFVKAAIPFAIMQIVLAIGYVLLLPLMYPAPPS